MNKVLEPAPPSITSPAVISLTARPLRLASEINSDKLVPEPAGLVKSPFELTLTRLARLKLQKPTQTMEEEAVAVFLEDICDHFDRRGFCYHAIDEGISRLIEREDEKFFPTMRTLISYIHPIHWCLKSRIDMVEKLLKRNFK